VLNFGSSDPAFGSSTHPSVLGHCSYHISVFAILKEGMLRFIEELAFYYNVTPATVSFHLNSLVLYRLYLGIFEGASTSLVVIRQELNSRIHTCNNLGS